MARGHLVRGLDRCDEPRLRARILVTLAHVESELGDRQTGLLMCDQALSIDGLPADLVGVINSQRGLLLMRAGLGDDALAAFADALAVLGDEPEARLRVHLNRGNVHLQRGDTRRAIGDFERAVVYADRAALPIQLAKAEHNLGFANLLAGNLVESLKLMDRARPTLAALSVVSAAVCEQDRAEVLAASGMVSDAERSLRDAAAAFGARKLRQPQAEAELTLARLLQVDVPAEAARVARRAQRRFDRRGSEGWSLRARAVAASAEIDSGRTTPAVLARADDLVAELTRHGLVHEASSLQLHVANALAVQSDADGARARLRHARVGSGSPLATRLLDREVRAELARRTGRRTAAIGHVRRGLADLHDWQSSFGSLDLQSSLVGHGRGLALQGLSLAVEDGRPAVVFEWAERARALATRVSPLRPPPDEESAADLSELRQLQAEVEAAETEGAVPRSLLAHANRLRARIRQRAWYGAGSGVVTEPAGLDEALAALGGSDGAIVSYLVVEDHVWALVVTSRHPELVSSRCVRRRPLLSRRYAGRPRHGRGPAPPGPGRRRPRHARPSARSAREGAGRADQGSDR